METGEAPKEKALLAEIALLREKIAQFERENHSNSSPVSTGVVSSTPSQATLTENQSQMGLAPGYFKLMEFFPEAIAVHQNGLIVAVNQAGLKLIGAETPADILGKPLLSVVHPDFRELVKARARQTQIQGRPAGLQEEKFIRLDGQEIDVEVVAIPVVFQGEPATQVIVRDVSEHKQLQKTLKDNEKQLRLITETIPALVSYLDKDLRYRFVNRRYEEWMAQPREVFIGKHPWEITAGIIPADFLKTRLEDLLKSKNPFIRYEATISYPDGIKRHVEVNYVTQRGSQGQVEGVVILVNDLSARRQIEEDLRASEERQRLASQAGGVGVFEWNIKTGELNRSEATTRIFGLPPGEFKGTIEAFYDLVDPRDLEKVRHEITESITNQKPLGVEYRCLRPDGRLIWIEAKGQVLSNEEGEPTRLVGVARDITAQKRAVEVQRFLAESSRILSSSIEYEETLQNVAKLIVPFLADWCSIDVRGEDGKVHSLGKAHNDPQKQELAEELARRYWKEFVHPDQVLPTVQRTGVAVFSPMIPPEILENSYYLPDHRRLLQHLGLTSTIVVPLKVRGQTFGDILLVRSDPGRRFEEEDFELAKELAQRAAQAIENATFYREAREAIRDREEFLSIAAHELKTPLTGLKGYIQLLERRLNREGKLDLDSIKSSLGIIDQQTEKLTLLINQLLDVSRFQLGKLVLEPEIVDLKPLVEEVVEVAQAETTRHQLKFSAPPGPVQISGDPIRLEQVLVNLVNNAIKYSPEGGLVEVNLSFQSSTFVEITVQDQGLGIPVEERPFIFERFFQGHKRSYLGGMGLGLYISRQIMELHGGRIEDIHPPEGGTRFVLSLPVSQPG